MKSDVDKLEALTEKSSVGQRRVIRMYRSLRSFVPQTMVFLVLAGSIFWLATVAPDDNAFAISSRSARWLSILPALWLLNMLRIYFNELYVFKSQVLCHHKGRVSIFYEMPVIYYSDIREIVVNQSMLGRFLNFGDILVGTAGTHGHEVQLTGVADPRAIQKRLERLRRIHMGQGPAKYSASNAA